MNRLRRFHSRLWLYNLLSIGFIVSLCSLVHIGFLVLILVDMFIVLVYFNDSTWKHDGYGYGTKYEYHLFLDQEKYELDYELYDKEQELKLKLEEKTKKLNHKLKMTELKEAYDLEISRLDIVSKIEKDLLKGPC